MTGVQTCALPIYHITELSRVLILVIFGVIRGDIDVNMQGIKAAVQSSHARERDTCVLLSWPAAHSNTAINHLISYKAN